MRKARKEPPCEQRSVAATSPRSSERRSWAARCLAVQERRTRSRRRWKLRRPTTKRSTPSAGSSRATLPTPRSCGGIAEALPARHPVQHAVLLFHGFTNCPQQFDELARRFHARGCNVYVPRIPHHGLKDRLTRDLENVTVDELADFTTSAFELTRAGYDRERARALARRHDGAMARADSARGSRRADRTVSDSVPAAAGRRPAVDATARDAAGDDLLVECPSEGALFAALRVPRLSHPCARATRPVRQRRLRGGGADETSGAPVRPRAERSGQRHRQRFRSSHDGALERARRGLHRAAADRPRPRHDIIDPTTYPSGRATVYPKLEASVLDDRAI